MKRAKLVCAFTALSVLYLGDIVSAASLIPNGTFSLGNTGFSTDYIYSPGNGGPATTYDVVSNPNSFNDNFVHIGDHTNNAASLMMVLNGADNPNQVVWSNNIAVSTNTTYIFSAWVANVCCIAGREPASGISPAELVFHFNGSQLGNAIFASNPGEWVQYLVTWNSGAHDTLNLKILNLNMSPNGNDFALDDISLVPTPLPTGVTLFTAGLVVVAGLAKRRKKLLRAQSTASTWPRLSVFPMSDSDSGFTSEPGPPFMRAYSPARQQTS